jgi:hypothetical protein
VANLRKCSPIILAFAQLPNRAALSTAARFVSSQKMPCQAHPPTRAKLYRFYYYSVIIADTLACYHNSNLAYNNERPNIMRILKILGILIALAVIGYMVLGMLGVGMIMLSGHNDAYLLGALTRRLLIYGSVVAGAIIIIVRLVKSIHIPSR